MHTHTVSGDASADQRYYLVRFFCSSFMILDTLNVLMNLLFVNVFGIFFCLYCHCKQDSECRHITGLQSFEPMVKAGGRSVRSHTPQSLGQWTTGDDFVKYLLFFRYCKSLFIIYIFV